MPRLAVLLVLLVAASWTPPAGAASGRVAGPDGKPLAGARACIQVQGGQGMCSDTDAEGWYRLPETSLSTVRITAAGYLPKSVAAVDQEGIVVLERAAALRARLLDAESGEPIARGELTLASPSGRKRGPFPVNGAGLRVATLAPGRVVPRGSAPGYRDAVGQEVELRAGTETEIVLRLARSTSGS
ncbi:MAG TPA: carboxypeptidase-like regulatory domain-containing protein [Candidatus Polarisedimenticolaceae bacterium]|nr:carboxypeptidase-like regulatory domain-containing protein [Candidatus Polarisedimenticolaceae bacterium]